MEDMNPANFIKQILGRQVSVVLSTGSEFIGRLVCLDGFMNVALEQCEEKMQGKPVAKYGDVFLRGNNGNKVFDVCVLVVVQVTRII